jgi:hypothetical protein
MSRAFSRLCLAGAATVLLVAVSASYASAMTVSLGTPTLSARVAISVPATVSCDPFDPTLTYFADGVTVSVQQAAGRQIARGTGSASGFPDVLFACDSAPHTISVSVAADPAGPPFHGGPAAFTTSAFAEAGICFGPDDSGGCSPIASQSASSGPTTLNLH